MLIYTVIRAAPDALASNISFIERYRTASRLVGEAQYYFVQTVSKLPGVRTCASLAHPLWLLGHVQAA